MTSGVCDRCGKWGHDLTPEYGWGWVHGLCLGGKKPTNPSIDQLIQNVVLDAIRTYQDPTRVPHSTIEVERLLRLHSVKSISERIMRDTGN